MEITYRRIFKRSVTLHKRVRWQFATELDVIVGHALWYVSLIAKYEEYGRVEETPSEPAIEKGVGCCMHLDTSHCCPIIHAWSRPS